MVFVIYRFIFRRAENMDCGWDPYADEFYGSDDGCVEQLYYEEEDEQSERDPQENSEVCSDSDYGGEVGGGSRLPEAQAHCSCQPGPVSVSSGSNSQRPSSSHSSESEWETDSGSASQDGSTASESDPCDCPSDAGTCRCDDQTAASEDSRSSWATASSSSWETASACSCDDCSAAISARSLPRTRYAPWWWDYLSASSSQQRSGKPVPAAQPPSAMANRSKLMRSQHQFSRSVVGDGGRPSAASSTSRRLLSQRSDTAEMVRHRKPHAAGSERHRISGATTVRHARLDPHATGSREAMVRRRPPTAPAEKKKGVTARARTYGRLRWTQLRRRLKSACAVRSDGNTAPSGTRQ